MIPILTASRALYIEDYYCPSSDGSHEGCPARPLPEDDRPEIECVASHKLRHLSRTILTDSKAGLGN
jgi:hypothetical protein